MRLIAERSVAIFTGGRSGSQHLVELLDSHPHIACDGEVLRGNRRFPRVHLASRALRRTNAMFSADVYGFKVTTNDLFWYPRRYPDPTRFLRRFATLPNVLVVLRRRNLLGQALSYLDGKRRQFHVRGESPTFRPLHVVPEELLASLWAYEVDDRRLVEVVRTLDHIELFYEEDLIGAAQQEATARRLLTALDLPVVPLQSRLRKAGPTDPLERIANFDEVRAALDGTRYAPLLEGSTNGWPTIQP